MFGTSALAASSTMDVDSTESNRGIVKVKFNTGSSKKIKLLIKNGTDKYYYNLSNNQEYVNFPLQLGDGRYTATIYENTSGNKYRQLHSESFTVKLEDENDVYLGSVQEIDWNEEDEAIKLANELVASATKEKNVALLKSVANLDMLTLEEVSVEIENDLIPLSDAEVIDLMYDYVVENVKYDYDKIKTLDYKYLPSIDSTLATGTGICYDYSSLLASMLRSQGIPTKLVKGYTSWTSVYHAWNEVYIASEDRWAIVDTTYDSYMYLRNRDFTFEKEQDVYKKNRKNSRPF